LTETLAAGLGAVLALAADTPEVSWTELVWVIRLLVTLTAGGQRAPALTLVTLFSGGTEAVWVLGARVAVTAPGETHALDTLIAGRAALIRVISAGVTVTAWRERGLALTILAHVSAGTEAVGILSAGVAVAAQGETLALDAALVSGAGGVLSRGFRVTITSRGELGCAAGRGEAFRRVGHANLL